MSDISDIIPAPSTNVDRAVFQGVCRVCMRKDTQMKCVFSSDLIQTVEDIHYCTGILINKEDGLPTTLCGACHINLIIAHQFKSACLRSDSKLRKILEEKLSLQKDIKEEVIDLDDGDGDDDYHYVMTKEDVEDFDDDNEPDFFDVIKIKEKHAVPIKPEVSKKTVIIGDRPESPLNSDDIKRLLGVLYCKDCDLEFTTRNQALSHRRNKHSSEWVCEFCGKKFTLRCTHYKHIQSHFPPQYHCTYCDYKVSQKADLKKHLRIHTGVKPYICEYCTLTFYNSSNLHFHIRRHHQGERKTHVCTRCDLAFYTACKLRRHLDTHDNIKRFECDVCHLQFSRRYHWKNHLQKQHSIVVPHIRPGRQRKSPDLTKSVI